MKRKKKHKKLRYRDMPQWWKDCDSHLRAIQRLWNDIKCLGSTTVVSFPALPTAILKSNRVKGSVSPQATPPMTGHTEGWY